MLVSVAEFKASPYYTEKYTDSAIQQALDYAERRFYELTNRAEFGYWFRPGRSRCSWTGPGRLLRARYPIVQLLYCGIIERLDGTETDVTSSVRVRNHFLWYRPGFREGFANVHVIALCGIPDLLEWSPGRAGPRSRASFPRTSRRRCSGWRTSSFGGSGLLVRSWWSGGRG